MSKKKKEYYVTKEDLWDAIKEFYDSNGPMNDKLGQMILDIATKTMTAQNFSGYDYREEMISDAILRMVSTLSERKFNLYGDKKVKEIQERQLKGYTFKGDLESQLGEGQVPFINNIKSKKAVFIYEIVPDEFFHVTDEKGHILNKKPVWDKTGTAKGVSIVPSDDSSEVIKFYTFIESNRKMNGRATYVSDKVYDESENPIQEKQNPFGYFSVITHHEAVGRIKKEQKNDEAVKKHQEDEFSLFMSENCEMTPQRMFDDTYEISSE